MTPLAPTGCRQVHLRRLTCRRLQRDDGLWDTEGRLTVTKPEAVSPPEREVQADEAIHDMLVCLSIDREFLIRDASARTLSASSDCFAACSAAHTSPNCCRR